jgi:hypothetical protein
MGRCPPGVLCIENITISYLVLSIGLFGVILYLYHKSNEGTGHQKQSPPSNVHAQPQASPQQPLQPPNVLQNPHVPPLRNTNPEYATGVPINVSTRAKDSPYTQVGILTRINGKETILPLMGRQLFANRDKWQYYTMSDQNNSVKLPVSSNGKSCTSEYGCDSLSNGDTVYLEGYNDAFKVTMYDNNVMRYIPFI